MKTLKKLLLSLLLLTSTLGLGQGILPYNSYSSYKYDTIANSNLNLIVSIPVRSKAGITPFKAALVVNSDVALTMDGNNVYSSPYLRLQIAGTGASTYHSQMVHCPFPDNNISTQLNQGFKFTDSTGALHSFPTIYFDSAGCLGNNDSEQSTDGTGLNAYATTNSDGTIKDFIVLDHDNNSIDSAAGLLVDKNGNIITFTSTGIVNGQATGYYTDTLGSNVLSVSLGSGYNGNDTYSYLGPDGVTQQNTTVIYTQKTIQTSFGCPSHDITGVLHWVPTSVSFPDTSSLSFVYEHGPSTPVGTITGRLASMTLPTGGTINYTYSGANNGIDCSSAGPINLARAENGLTETYAHTKIANGSFFDNQVVKTLPFGGTETILSGYINNYTFSDIVKDSTGSTVSTVLTYQNGVLDNQYPYPISTIDVYKYKGDTTVTAASSHVSTTLDTTAYAYPTDIKTYIPASSGTVYTETVLPGVNYPASSVTTSGGVTVDSSQFTYDNHSNRTSISKLIAVGGTSQTIQNTYNPNGSVASTTDAFGAASSNNVTSCNNTLATSSLFNGVSTSFTWDCNGGVPTAASNVLGTSTAQYNDVFFRPTQATDQSNFSANSTFTPNRVQANETVGTHTVTSYKTFDGVGNTVSNQDKNGSAYDTTSNTYSGTFLTSMSLPCSTTTLGATCTTTKFSYTYDSVGRLVTKTDSTTGATETYSYNANDVKVTTSGGTSPVVSTQTEVDGLGRVVSVCEITTSPGYASCGQTSTASGFLTTYGYNAVGDLTTITQFANGTPQTRPMTYDLIHRKLTETTPESGLVQFWYDTAPSSPGVACTAYASGKLVKRYDARGNTTCYSYDAIGRVASVVYSGPGSTGVNKYFVYDFATVNSQTMQNTTNRLAEAYTATSVGGTKITDFGFSYNARGDKTDVYESTPNSGGYYHTIASYYANGAIATLGGVPGIPNWAFGVDSMGRFQTLSETSNCNGTCNHLVSDTYYALGRTTRISYGSGDYDAFVYSSTTGRQSSYTLHQNTSTIQDVLTWFPTGQLSKQAFTDTVTPANAQTCTYTYDSLNRLSSDNCGSVWSQTFAYDQFGNIAKSGSVTFSATYNNKNEIATLGSNVPTYDASGNLLTINTGVLHTYTWDAENRVASIDGKTLTYDAFDRVVEENLTQILYGPTGKLGVQSGQTNTRTYLGLPKSAGIIYDGSSVVYQHPDLLGNGILGTNTAKGKVLDRFFAPFGEEYANSGATVADFTGHTQDLDGSLFDFTFREQSPIQGRWLNPDPSGMAAVSLGDPQTLNRYAYVRGSAMGMTDPNGLRGEYGSGWFWSMFGVHGGYEVRDFVVPDLVLGNYSTQPDVVVGGGSKEDQPLLTKEANDYLNTPIKPSTGVAENITVTVMNNDNNNDNMGVFGPHLSLFQMASNLFGNVNSVLKLVLPNSFDAWAGQVAMFGGVASGGGGNLLDSMSFTKDAAEQASWDAARDAEQGIAPPPVELTEMSHSAHLTQKLGTIEEQNAATKAALQGKTTELMMQRSWFMDEWIKIFGK